MIQQVIRANRTSSETPTGAGGAPAS